MKTSIYNVVGEIRTIVDGWHEDWVNHLDVIDADDAMYSIYSILTEEGLL